MRIFTPSFTDLSYLLFVLPKEFSAILSDDQQNLLESIDLIEQIENGGEKVGADYRIIYYPKPNDGIFQLRLHSNLFNQELLERAQVFLYRNDGDFQQVTLGDLIANQQNLDNLKQFTLQINYFKDALGSFESSVEEKTIDEKTLAKLDAVANWSQESFGSGQLSFYLFYQLNLLIDSLRDHLDYIFLLEKFLEFHGL